MNACCTGQLCQTADGILHISRCHHHQVGKLVYDNDDLTHFLRALLTFREGHLVQLAVELLQITHAILCKGIVTVAHLIYRPVQSTSCLLRVCDNRNKQMGNSIVDTKLHHLGVDHDQLHLIRFGFI